MLGHKALGDMGVKTSGNYGDPNRAYFVFLKNYISI
jgi:hypothetical protein